MGGSRGRQNFLSSEQRDKIEAYVCSSQETRQMSYLKLAINEFLKWAGAENHAGNALPCRGNIRRISLRKLGLDARHKIFREQWARDHST